MKKVIYTFWLLPLLCLGSAADAEFPFYSAAKTATAPTIDGSLTEDCWQHAERTAPFVVIGGNTADVRTTGMLCWDNSTLYIAVVCEEPRMTLLEERLQSGQVTGFEESIEVFLDVNHDRSSFVQLRLGITGTRESREAGSISPQIQAGWRAAVARQSDKWTAEIAIPFELLSAGRPETHSIWGLNLNRQRLIGPDDDKWTCWSDTKGAFATPSRFGNLVFATYPLWLRHHYRRLTGDLMDEIAALMMHYPAAGKPLLPEMTQLDDHWIEFLKELATSDENVVTQSSQLRSKGDIAVAAYDEFLARLRLAIIKTAFH